MDELDHSYRWQLQRCATSRGRELTGLAGRDCSNRGVNPILFKAHAGFMPLSVSLSGQSIPIFAVGTGPNYTLFGGDISAFGGQTVELEFAALPPNSNWTIDSIEFSSQAVPEPSVLTLVALGSVFLIWCVRHRTRLP